MADPKADADPVVTTPAAGGPKADPAADAAAGASRVAWKPDVPEGFKGINASIVS
jgi:hypothetical protein